MKKANCIAAVFGTGLALVSWITFAQAQAVQPVDTPAASAIPGDQQPTKEQLNRLFELIRVQDQLASITNLISGTVQQQITAQMKQMRQDHPEMASVTEEQEQAFTKVLGKFMGRIMDIYPAGEMIADMTRLYQKYMTRSDIDGIIAFYSSPAGRHLLDTQPAIMQEYMPLVMQRMQDRVKPLTDEMTKELMEITKSKVQK